MYFVSCCWTAPRCCCAADPRRQDGTICADFADGKVITLGVLGSHSINATWAETGICTRVELSDQRTNDRRMKCQISCFVATKIARRKSHDARTRIDVNKARAKQAGSESIFRPSTPSVITLSRPWPWTAGHRIRTYLPIYVRVRFILLFFFNESSHKHKKNCVESVVNLC